MKITDFITYYDKLNTTLPEGYENSVYYREGEHQVNFLEKFIKVFPTINGYQIDIDNGIGFIVVSDDIFIGEEFLDFCLEKGLQNEDAFNFYYHDLELNMDRDLEDLLKHKETYKTFDDKPWSDLVDVNDHYPI